ncbi:hypothetical protein BDN72DRAFT_901490 [Pluteus cervinus]|uniref:Uncharacterized protein n=1 Tax=Pluteus cervinus TaxID=181527 RepID=A0ACD3AG72_9AGAR|nr:hypothetical protein BDN72DRAFT_901490 [Pluteus cervinus]
MILELSNTQDHLQCEYGTGYPLPLYYTETTQDTTTLKKLKPDYTGSESTTPFSQDSYEVIGRVKLPFFGPDLIEYGTKLYKASELLKKEARLPKTLKRSRIFEGPDGVKYKWILGPTESELVVDQGAADTLGRIPRIPVATFFPYEFNSASLEIKPEGILFTDLILLTFLYVEHKWKCARQTYVNNGAGNRRGRNKGSASSGGAYMAGYLAMDSGGYSGGGGDGGGYASGGGGCDGGGYGGGGCDGGGYGGGDGGGGGGGGGWC